MAIKYNCDICKKVFDPISGITNGGGKMMLPLPTERMVEIDIRTIKCNEVCFKCMGAAFIAVMEGSNDKV